MEITLPTTGRGFMTSRIKVAEAIAKGALTMTIHPASIRCTVKPLRVRTDFIIAHGREEIQPAITNLKSSSATTSKRSSQPTKSIANPKNSKFVDSHLKPYRCKAHACENARFSSTACLLRHEREEHLMHGHGEKPFLCTFDGCERGVPGNGFPRHWNLCDHMKRAHNRSPSPLTSTAKPLRGSKKRKNSTGETDAGKKSRAPVRSLSLTEQYQRGHQQLLSELMDVLDDLSDIEAAEQKLERATNYLKLMVRTIQQMKLGLKDPPP